MDDNLRIIGELYVEIRKVKDYIDNLVKALQEKEEQIARQNALIEELDGLLRVNSDKQVVSEN